MGNYFSDNSASADSSSDTGSSGNYFTDNADPGIAAGKESPLRITIAPPKPSPARDFAQSIPGGMVSGLSNVLSASGQAAQAEMAQPIDVASPQQTEAILQQNVTGALPQPQGTAGQYGRTMGQFVAQAPFSPPIPGVGPVAAGVGAIGAGVASEAAGQATAGTPYENVARLAAPVVSALLTRRPPEVSEAQALKVGSQVAEVPATQQLVTTGAAQMNAATAGATKTFSPDTMNELVSNIENKLKAAKSRDYLAPETFRSIQELKNETNAAGIQSVRELLGETVKDGGKDGRAALLAQQEIDKFLKENESGVAAGLEEGRGNYAAGMRAQAADAREQIATLRQKRAGYGGNARFVAATRQILSPIVEKAIKFGQKGGHSDEEIQAMKDIIEGTTLTNTLRNFGMVSPEKGILSLAVGSELVKTVGAKIAGIIATAGLVANKLNSDLTVSQINRLNEMLRKRSPMYEKAVKDAATRYTNSMNDFANSPTQQSFVKFLVASRNFSAGLRKDGIPLSSGDLLKGVKATGDNEGNENQ